MLLAVLIFVATIALVIWQPKGLGIGWSAMGGAVVALLAGVVSDGDDVRVEPDESTGRLRIEPVPHEAAEEVAPAEPEEEPAEVAV